MKWARLVAVIVAGGLFALTFSQYPTTDVGRIAGQVFGSVVVGLVVYGVGWLIIRQRRG